MKSPRFKPYEQGQTILFPADMGERIPEHAPVRLISRIVDGLELSPLLETYRIEGCPAYHPRMMLKLIFYAYMNNIYSCRRIEREASQNIHFIWLSGAQYPSFATINRFRSERLKKCINDLFIQVVKVLVEAGVVSLEEQYVDGTKIESAANKYSFVWRKNVERHKGNLERKLKGVVSQIDEGIAQDNAPSPDDDPTPFSAEELRNAIAKINQRAEKMPISNRQEKADRRTVVKKARDLEKMAQKHAQYEEQLNILGDRNSYSKTDPDATFMRMKEDAMNNGQTKPGYNLQIATNNQFITHFALFPNPTDTLTLPPFLNSFVQAYGKAPTSLCADAGYGSEENYHLLEQHQTAAYVKYNYFHQEQRPRRNPNPFAPESLFYNKTEDYYVCPMGQHMTNIGSSLKPTSSGYPAWITRYRAQHCKPSCPLRGQCTKKRHGARIIEVNHELNRYKSTARDLLLSSEGLRQRGRRCIEPEAVFGQIKFNKGYKRFRHYSKDKVNMDFGLLAIAFNLQKYVRKLA